MDASAIPGQPEILRYLNHVADRFDLQARHPASTPASPAPHYDEARQPLAGRRPRRARRSRRTFLITAVGCLSTANVPKIPGLDTFAGQLVPHRAVAA